VTTSYDYSVTATLVAGELPGIDDANIGANTEPISTTNLTAWINEGAAIMNAIVLKSGITPSASMDADAHDTLFAAVKAYAIHKALLVLGISGPVLDAARDVWNTAKAHYSNRPQDLGDAYTDGSTVTIDTDTKADDWPFVNSEGNIW
jgi:hypothetical protein